jgi:hypothetical protein
MLRVVGSLPLHLEIQRAERLVDHHQPHNQHKLKFASPLQVPQILITV